LYVAALGVCKVRRFRDYRCFVLDFCDCRATYCLLILRP
jgi:hypothetical protein